MIFITLQLVWVRCCEMGRCCEANEMNNGRTDFVTIQLQGGVKFLNMTLLRITPKDNQETVLTFSCSTHSINSMFNVLMFKGQSFSWVYIVLICKSISSGFCKGRKKFRQTLWINYDFSPRAPCIVWCIHPKHWAFLSTLKATWRKIVTPWCLDSGI